MVDIVDDSLNGEGDDGLALSARTALPKTDAASENRAS